MPDRGMPHPRRHETSGCCPRHLTELAEMLAGVHDSEVMADAILVGSKGASRLVEQGTMEESGST